jgi:hypothetical protein
MNKLTQTLLTGAALCALGAAPAMAQPKHPAMHVTALYAGHAVNKTKFHYPGRQQLTYTYGIYSTRQLVLDKKVPLGAFYKWNSSNTLCSNPKQKVKFDSKKTQYGKLSVATETYSYGCPSGPTVFYGADYKLTDPAGFGNTDHFVVHDLGWFKNNGNKYKGTLNTDFSLTITE